MVSGRCTGSPSTREDSAPNAFRLSPVAVTTMSAGSSSPDVSSRPFGVNESIRSVTIDASPRLIARNRSPSGTRHRRWSQGLYVGRKWVSTSYPSGSWAAVALRIRRRTRFGRRRLSW